MWKSAPPVIHFSLANSVSSIPLDALIVSVKNTQNLVKNSFPGSFAHPLHASCPPIGGQAVLEGVMMRNGDIYALAVRQTDGRICAERRRWKSFLVRPWLRLPFVRGFPILLETIWNGIQALNRSAAIYENSDSSSQPGFWNIVFSVVLAFLVAVALFVVAPHLLSLLMLFFGIGGDVEGFTFHLWDGLYKCLIFVCYLWLISFIPDIHRVFQYHGAEHKTIHAFESGTPVTADSAFYKSRLHPRCGTTFLLFVIVISIALQAVLLPTILSIWSPDAMWSKHIYSLGLKIFLALPISAAAYELIRFAASLPNGPVAVILQWPGLALQRLTTREPTREQLEVALVALAEAAGEDGRIVRTSSHMRISSELCE